MLLGDAVALVAGIPASAGRSRLWPGAAGRRRRPFFVARLQGCGLFPDVLAHAQRPSPPCAYAPALARVHVLAGEVKVALWHVTVPLLLN